MDREVLNLLHQILDRLIAIELYLHTKRSLPAYAYKCGPQADPALGYDEVDGALQPKAEDQ
jgi:hypothetical protein